MLMNNLDPAVAERPDDLIVYGGSGTRRAIVGSVRRHRRHAAPPRARRDAAHPIRQARRRLPHASLGAARHHRQLAAGAGLGHVGRLPRPRRPRPDDVRPDDGRQLDLYRHAGHPPGHLRNARRAGAPAFRRHPVGPARRHRRPRRHGRRPAARRHDERAASRSSIEVDPDAHPAPARDPLRGRARRARSTTRSRASTQCRRRRRARGRSRSKATPPTCCPSSCAAASSPDVRHRSDLGARRAQRLRARTG